MTWQFYTSIGILLFSLNSLLHRILMKDGKSDPYAQTLAFYGLGGMIVFVMLLFRGGFQFHISPAQIPWFIILALCTLAPIAAFKAYKQIEASEATILFSTQRLWIVLGAFSFLHESFSISKVMGTLIILTGITVAMWRKQKFVMNRGAWFALIAAFVYAVSDIASFFILRDFDVLSFSVFACFMPVVTLLLIKPGTIKKLNYYRKPQYAVAIIVVSIFDTLATLATNTAYQVGRNAAQISPLMSTQIILSVVLAVIFLKERDHAFQKILGAVIVVIGVFFIL